MDSHCNMKRRICHENQILIQKGSIVASKHLPQAHEAELASTAKKLSALHMDMDYRARQCIVQRSISLTPKGFPQACRFCSD